MVVGGAGRQLLEDDGADQRGEAVAAGAGAERARTVHLDETGQGRIAAGERASRGLAGLRGEADGRHASKHAQSEVGEGVCSRRMVAVGPCEQLAAAGQFLGDALIRPAEFLAHRRGDAAERRTTPVRREGQPRSAEHEVG